MKSGTKVWVCHDGKWGRREPGVVLFNKKGYKIQIRFTDSGSGEEYIFWVKRRPAIRYRSSRRFSCVSYHKRKVSYAGFLPEPNDFFIPWFSVYRMDKEEVPLETNVRSAPPTHFHPLPY